MRLVAVWVKEMGSQVGTSFRFNFVGEREGFVGIFGVEVIDDGLTEVNKGCDGKVAVSVVAFEQEEESSSNMSTS